MARLQCQNGHIDPSRKDLAQKLCSVHFKCFKLDKFCLKTGFFEALVFGNDNDIGAEEVAATDFYLLSYWSTF